MTPLPPRSGGRDRILLALLFCLSGWQAGAQSLSPPLPADIAQDIPGYDATRGVTVQSRLRPDYQPQGQRVGDFVVRADVAQSVGYDSNVFGTEPGRGSFIAETAPTLSVASDWSRDALFGALSLDNQAYLQYPNQSRTDWTGTIGGAYMLGREPLRISYSHLSLHQDRTDLGALPTDTPVPFQVEALGASYLWRQARFTFEPTLNATIYRFDSTTIGGLAAPQAFRDRDVLQASLLSRYELTPERSLVVMLRSTNATYTSQPAASVNQNSTGYEVLAGIDDDINGLWRLRLLGGYGVRSFQSPGIATYQAPIAEASVVWTPTALTTVSGWLIRTIQDADIEGATAAAYTGGQLAIDHEYLRNLLLNIHGGVQQADFLQLHQSQTLYSAGAGITWLLGRHLRLGLTYDYTTEQGPPALGNFIRSIALLRLQAAL